MTFKIMLILSLVFSFAGVVSAESVTTEPVSQLNDGGPGW